MFNLSSFIAQLINIAVITFVLWKFFFKPYLAFLDEESKKRLKLEEDIKNSSHIVKNANMEASKILDKSRIDARNIANEIIENARREADNIKAEASIEAENVRKKGFDDIEYERKTLAKEMKQKVLQVAIKMNEKFFGKNDANEQFLKNSHKDITL